MRFEKETGKDLSVLKKMVLLHRRYELTAFKPIKLFFYGNKNQIAT